MAANAAPTPDASTIRQIKRRAARNFAIVENVDVGGERDIYFQQSLDWSDAALFGGTQIILETKNGGAAIKRECLRFAGAPRRV